MEGPMSMRLIIECCAGNMHHGTDQVIDHYEQDSEVDVIEYGCLGNCGECYRFPYVMVNGETVTAETPEQLTALIKQKIMEIKQGEPSQSSSR